MRTASLYRYLCAGALRLVASLCVTAWAWSHGRLVRYSSLPDALQGRRLGALWTILSLLTLLVVSGPHLVHHLADSAAPDDHHTPAGSAHPPPDCPVFFVMQHIPVAGSVVVHSCTPLATAESIICVPPRWMSEAPKYVLQARAPPVFLL